mgnify:CR=1 FL=1
MIILNVTYPETLEAGVCCEMEFLTEPAEFKHRVIGYGGSKRTAYNRAKRAAEQTPDVSPVGSKQLAHLFGVDPVAIHIDFPPGKLGEILTTTYPKGVKVLMGLGLKMGEAMIYFRYLKEQEHEVK